MVVWNIVWGVLLCSSIDPLSGMAIDDELQNTREVEGKHSSLGLQDIPDQWFTQLLDHFNPTEKRTWQQRYRTRTDLYKPGGPAFLLIDGEWESKSQEISRNWAFVVNAKKYNAHIFQVEHRFYGQSVPISEGQSLDKFKYLSSEQAIADLANFIKETSLNLPKGTKWIVFGGSYAGNLAAWVRYKYPQLVYGAVASSAPVLGKLDFSEYLDVVKESVRRFGGDSCVKVVEDANNEIEDMLKTPEGRKDIEKKFGWPKIDVHDKDAVSMLFFTLASPVMLRAQYNSYIKWNGKITSALEEMCDTLKNKALGGVVDRYADIYNNNYANNNYDNKLTYPPEIHKRLTIQITNGHFEFRPWVYQKCTEFGYFKTSESKGSLIGNRVSLDFLIRNICIKNMGDKYNKTFVQRAVEHTNTVYGGLKINATRVIYVHGSVDPWHALGITKTRISESPVIFINGTSHCADMLPAWEHDLPALIEAREQVSSIIGQWLRSS